MDFQVGDKVKHVKYPMGGIIVAIVEGKITTYKIEIEVGYLYATKKDLILDND